MFSTARAQVNGVAKLKMASHVSLRKNQSRDPNSPDLYKPYRTGDETMHYVTHNSFMPVLEGYRIEYRSL